MRQSTRMFRPVVILLVLAASALAQTSPEQELRTINKQYQAQVLAKDYDGAIASITRMLDVAAAGHVRVNRGQMLYARACFNALSGRKDRAISDARAAVDAGFSDTNAFESDPDLSSVRDDPEFQSFLAVLKHGPSATSPEPAPHPAAAPPQPTKPPVAEPPPSDKVAEPVASPPATAPAASGEQQSLIVYWKTAGRETRRVAAVAEKLRAAIARDSVGELNGVEFGDTGSTIYINGPDADRIYDVAAPVLRDLHPARGSYVVKRYGQPGAREIRIFLAGGE